MKLSNLVFSLRLAFHYILAKLNFIQPFLPESLRDKLPIGWNNQMFWTVFSSSGKKVYYDYYLRCMVLLPGTQKEIYPVVLGENPANDGDDVRIYGNNFYAEIDYPVDSAEKITIPMKAGQFFLFTERVIHGSVENVTDNSRWSVGCRIVNTDTRIYTKEVLEKGYKDIYFHIKNISVDNWKALLVRGKDHFGYNRLFKE